MPSLSEEQVVHMCPQTEISKRDDVIDPSRPELLWYKYCMFSWYFETYLDLSALTKKEEDEEKGKGEGRRRRKRRKRNYELCFKKSDHNNTHHQHINPSG